MKLRTELISEIRTLAVTFKAGDAVAAWISGSDDEMIQSVLGSRVRTIQPAIKRIEDHVEGLVEFFEEDSIVEQELEEADEAAEELDDDTQEDDEGDSDIDPKRMAEKLKKARARYTASVAHSGRPSSNNADDLAKFLGGMTPQEVCNLADAVVDHCDDHSAGEMPILHWEFYMEKGLNQGSIRMNAGNKIRSRVKNDLITIDEIVAIVL
jgi:hypothetical protein